MHAPPETDRFGRTHEPGNRWDERFAEFARLDVSARLRLLVDLGMTDDDIGSAFPSATPRSVRRWRAGDLSARLRARRWDIIDDIGALASAYLTGGEQHTPEVLVHWLRTRNRELEERRPLQCLADGESGYRRVRAALARDLLS